MEKIVYQRKIWGNRNVLHFIIDMNYTAIYNCKNKKSVSGQYNIEAKLRSKKLDLFK